MAGLQTTLPAVPDGDRSLLGAQHLYKHAFDHSKCYTKVYEANRKQENEKNRRQTWTDGERPPADSGGNLPRWNNSRLQKRENELVK